MGLLDVLNGMQNGPRGQQNPGTGSSGGGMSPMTMAVLGLLAYKAVKHYTQQPDAVPSGQNANSGSTPAAGQGGLGDILRNGLGSLLSGQNPAGSGGTTGGMLGSLGGGLGGLLAGAGAGTVLSSGLNDLLKTLQQNGQGAAASSWVGQGANEPIAPNDLAKALGEEQINTLTAQTGMSRDDLLAGLSKHLPDIVNQLTPDGRVPTAAEIGKAI